MFNDPPQIAAARALVDEKLAGILLVEQKVAFDIATDYIYAASYHDEMGLASRMLGLLRAKARNHQISDRTRAASAAGH